MSATITAEGQTAAPAEPDTRTPAVSSAPAATVAPLTNAERLRQLRVDWPGWSFEHRGDHPVAWVAERQYLKGWRGGHPVCEAETADILEYLLRQAVQLDAMVALLSERARR